ncbi:endonuclease/exonuclease/phosphatase family protein [Runella sp.]|uniref:endonuclease/exonuclease/phosphatase family protein n=1 Tax=Runella sp. TaxID=1960881 RepID=UPI003D12675A
MVRILKQWLNFASWAVLFASLIGFLGEYSRWFDHFASFRVQYCLLSLALLLWQLYRRQWLLAVVSLGIFLFNGWLGLEWIRTSQANSPDKADITLYHANVLYKNHDFSLVTQQIREENPDFFSINEATPALIAHLKKTFTKEYPYTFFVVAKNDTEVFVGSQTPIVVDSAATFAIKGLIKFSTVVQDKPVTIIACHAYNPIKETDFIIRNQQLRHIAALVKKEPNPTIVVGDLNITPWSVIYRQFISASGLINSRKGFGLNPSWPSWMPLMLIPIDHCLINDQLETVAFRTGKYNKSDHYPLLIHLRFR